MLNEYSHSAIRCILMCEFHPTAGPKIRCQVPENYITKAMFDMVSSYLIPKAQIKDCITVNLDGYQILGYPIKIENEKYLRNAFHFNLCLVFDEETQTIPYEPLLKKLSNHMLAMELHHEFLSKPTTEESDDVTPPSNLSTSPNFRELKKPLIVRDVTKTENNFDRLIQIMAYVKHHINRFQMCIVTDGPTKLHLTVVDLPKDPTPILNCDVPILTGQEENFDQDQWDHTTNQIIEHIDGFSHITKIACKAEVHPNLVKICIQQLVCYNIVKVIPLIQYSSSYIATSKINKIMTCPILQKKCVDHCSSNVRQPAVLNDIFRMYCAMHHEISLRNLCLKINPNNLRINERKLVQFGLLHGIIRKINKFPVACPTATVSTVLYNNQSMEEICCSLNISNQTLEREIELDEDLVLLCA